MIRPLLLAVALVVQLPVYALFAQDGKAIYREQCALCHGGNGEGVKGKYPERLEGDLSVSALAELIEGTMPDEDPERCVAEDADAVAQYIFGEFYSAEARARMQATIELTHRTNFQIKNSIADLAGRFSGRAWFSENQKERGFKGRYFSSRHFDSTKSIGERVDSTIQFDFGNGSPLAPQVEMEEFGIQWFATLRVEETGLYDFIVDSPNGFRLFINDSKVPVIDAWVSSGSDSQDASIYLLAGHSYLVKLDMFKFQEDSASISLRWRPPFGKVELIPSENLRPNWAPNVLVTNTVLPPDDSSVGYARGTSVSKAWLEAVSESALETANVMLADPEKYMGVKKQTTDREKKFKEFCQKFATFAFCRPLNEEQIEIYVNSQFEDSDSPEAAAKKSILLVLQSPLFLYPELSNQPVDSYSVAARMSLTLWDSLPDQELWSAASGGNLAQHYAVGGQARRMLKDPRTRAKIRSFFHHWLEMNAEDLTKDEERYPEFNKAIAADLRTSLELFLDDVVWGEGSDYRRLYSSGEIYTSSLMANYYGIKVPGYAPANLPPTDGVQTALSTESAKTFNGFLKVEAGSETRFGILTHPYLMTGLSYHRTTSPIHRGVFVARRLIGRSLKQPPENFEPLEEDFDPEMTTRERVAHQTKDKSCQTCHSFINPLGFSLEGLDAVGRFRTSENGKTIDTTSVYTTEAEVKYELAGPRELASYLVDSDKARKNFVRHLFQHLVKHPPGAYGKDTLDLLDRSFVQSQYNIQKLIVTIVEITSLHGTEAASKLEIFKLCESNQIPQDVPSGIESGKQP